MNDLLTLSKVYSPCATVYLPTHVHGHGTISDARHFHHLINEAANRLRQRGISSVVAETALNPARMLANHHDFWQHQSEGLALFASPRFWSHHSLHRPVREQLVVNDIFYLRQLIPFVTNGEKFHVLTLGQKSIRLLTADKQSITEAEVADLPDSIDEDLWYEMPQRELQVRSTGGHHAMFHGHGQGDELDKQRVERFLRHVDRAVSAHLANDHSPVVLAGVDYHIAIFRHITNLGSISDNHVEGSVDQRTDLEIHAAAWDAVKAIFDAPRRARIAQFRNVRGTGLTLEELPEILEAATEGRIDTLFLGDTTAELDDFTEALVNSAIRRSLHTGAATYESPDLVDDPARAFALLRY